MNFFLILFILGNLQAQAETNSLGLRGGEVPPKKEGVYRILIMGPGLSSDELKDELLPSVQLQNNLNRDCKNCYEVINASIEGYFSTQYLQLLNKIYDQIQPDLIVYYESGKFLPLEILERFRYTEDPDTGDMVPKSDEELYKNPCCEFFLNSISESLRRRLAFVLNYTATFKDSKALDKRDLETVSEGVLQNFGAMGRTKRNSRPRKFLLLLNPPGFKVDYLVFEGDPLQEILFKFLIYFYEPEKISLKVLFTRQGFDFRSLGPIVKDLYTPPFLMYRRSYELNSQGAQLWGRAASRTILKFLRSDRESEDDSE